jgi:diguanylate cyclase (GGDEF)-like protein
VFRVLTCIAAEHDFRLVLLAAAICATAAFTSFRIFARATDPNSVRNQGYRRLAWLALTGLSTGAGIWSTHFVAMLAYGPGFPVAYDPALTFVSLVIAIGVTTVGFMIAATGQAAGSTRHLEAYPRLNMWLADHARSVVWALGGVVVAVGIATMHYVGMAAVSVPGVIEWDRPYVVASVLLGILFAGAAMVANFLCARKRALWLAPLLLTLAICSLHFTAMAAALVVPDPTIVVQASFIHTSGMAMGVAIVTMLVMLSAVGAALVNAQADREAKAELRRHNEILRQRDKELEERNQQLDAALNNMVQGLAMYDAEQRLVVANKRYGQIYHLAAEEMKPGTPLLDIVKCRIAKGLHPGETVESMLEGMRAHARSGASVQYHIVLTDGSHIAVAIQPMTDGGCVTTHHDITAQRQSEAKIEHMALHDGLTGLANRTLLSERLEHALAGLNDGEYLALHLLDLDLFKNVNDTLGHSAGDEVLKLVAARLGSVCRRTDTIARMGGDEFVIAQTGCGSPADAQLLADRVIQVVSQPYFVEGQEVVIATSVGIAIAPVDARSADQLMRNADLALYKAKSDGRGGYRFFEPHMNALMQARRSMERDMRKALTEGQFELYYQPIVDLHRNAVTGCETLVRWQHPEKGLVPPGEFIHIAEETGLIIPLGEWIIRDACKTAARWPDRIRIAVNLSPVQFRRPGLVQVVMNALASSGLPAHRLELEITETVLLEDSALTLAMLHQLRDLGVHIAMDDFGTGYSSLSYLQQFPFDKIKIDRSFVKEIPNSKSALNIVRAVAALASGLGMATTAEGVETQEQLDAITAEGCTEMQGYLLSCPRPANEIEKLFMDEQAIAPAQVVAADETATAA